MVVGDHFKKSKHLPHHILKNYRELQQEIPQNLCTGGFCGVK